MGAGEALREWRLAKGEIHVAKGIKIHDKVFISTKPEEDFHYLYVNRVEEILGEHLFLISASAPGGRFTKPILTREYHFFFYTDGGVLQTKGSILDFQLLNETLVLRIETGEYKHIQRRLFYRVNLMVPFSFTRVLDALRPDGNVPAYRGIARDLSGGGLRFVSSVPLEVNEHILCKLTLKGTPMTVEGQVLSVEPLAGGREYMCRVEMININSRQQEAIIQYVFDRQNEMLKKGE